MPPKTKGRGRGASTSRGRGQRGKVVESSSSSSHEEVDIHSDSSSTASDTQPTPTPQRSFSTRRFPDATMEIDEFEGLELDASIPRPPIPSRPATAARARSKRTHPASEIVITTSKRLRSASTSTSVSVPMTSPPLSPTSQPSMPAPSPQVGVSSPATPTASTMPHTPISPSQAQSPPVITPLVPRNLRVFNTDFHIDEEKHRKLMDNRSKKVFSCRSVSFRGDRAIQSLQEYFVDWLPYFEFLDRSRCFEYPVRCFYANITSMPATTPIKSYFVRDITVTPDLISQLIGVPNVGADIFADTLAGYASYGEGESAASASLLIHGSSDPKLITSEHFVHLAFLPRCLARIIGGSIFAKAGNRDKTTGCHKLLTYLLLKKIKVNLPLLLYKIIGHGIHYGRSYYPHGTIISSVLTHHGLDLSTFPEIARLEPFSQKNLSLMDFKAQGAPITLETPLPSRGSSAAGPSSTPIPPSEPTTESVPPPTGPSPSTSSSAPEPRYPDVLTLLPLLSVPTSHRTSIRELLPLLQHSLLGMVNDNIRSHNETRDALFTGLGLPLMPHRPLYTFPHATATVSSPYSPTATTPPPPPPPPTSSVAPSLPPRAVRFDDHPHVITSRDLSRTFEAISLPTLDSELADLSELIAGIARSSGVTGPLAGISTAPAPTATMSLPTTMAIVPIFTTSDITAAEPIAEPDPVLLIQSGGTPILPISSPSPTAIVPYMDSDTSGSS